MPSSDKFPSGLNKWSLYDNPQMEDFNSDNEIIDEALQSISPVDVDGKIEDHNISNYSHSDIRQNVSSAGSLANNAASMAATANTTANAALPKPGGTMTGQLIAQSNTAYTTAQVRNAILSTTDLTAGTSTLANGALYFVYE